MGVEVAAGIAVGGFIVNQVQRSKDRKAAKKRAGVEADLIEEQTEAEVKRREELIEDTIDAQRLAILNSGTLIDDSPIMILEETREKSLEELESFKKVQSRRAGLTRGRVRDEFLGGVPQDLASGFNIIAPFLR